MPHLPFALDNGAYGAFTNGTPWDAEAFVKHVERYAFGQLRPLWCVVPDVVANAVATFESWAMWAEQLRRVYNLTLALAVQDGMTPEDVRRLTPSPDVVFVGGSTEWKWATVGTWCAEFPRVHVGRVNTEKQLAVCAAAGAESCDGTGWFRGDPKQIAQLGHFLRCQAGCGDARDVDRMVFHSRFKHSSHSALPFDEVAMNG